MLDISYDIMSTDSQQEYWLNQHQNCQLSSIEINSGPKPVKLTKQEILTLHYSQTAVFSYSIY